MNAEITGYATAFDTYHRRGWSVVPLPRGKKKSPPEGFTGGNGRMPSYPDMQAWADTDKHRNGNLAIVLPSNVIGIDVDHYGGKRGGDTIAEAETRWGKLPFSPRSTARHDGDCVSGIRLYRIPEGVRLRDRIEFPDLGLGGVEVVQHHHRYVVCWPSWHPEGDLYLWLGIDGGMLDDPPAIDDLPELPPQWVEGNRETAPNGAELPPDGAYDVSEAITGGEPSKRVRDRLSLAVEDIAGNGCRHDVTRDHVLGLLRYGKQGEPGVRDALLRLRKVFVNLVGSDRDGGKVEAQHEFDSFVNGERVAVLLADDSYDDDETDGGETDSGTDGNATESDTPVLADRLLTRSDLLKLPDPEPLIDNVLDQGTTALLYGKWGTAKSFIALDWAASVPTGRTWQARDSVQRRVLYVVGEGAFGFKGRVDAWETGWRTTIADEWLSILPVPVNLTRLSDVTNLAALISWGGYGFVILDTLARCMVGSDENSAKDCGIVVDSMSKLLGATLNGRGVILGVHHAGKDGTTLRGSSVFEGAADTVYFTDRDEMGWIGLTREKRKDGPEHDHHVLRVTPMPGTDSAVIEAGSRPDTPRGECKVSTAELAEIVHRVITAQPDQSVGSLRKLFAAMRLAGHDFRESDIRLSNDYLVLAGRLIEVPGKRNAIGYRAVLTAAPG
jgi:hypothetical protein